MPLNWQFTLGAKDCGTLVSEEPITQLKVGKRNPSWVIWAFLRTIAELKTTVAQQQKQIEGLTATVRKVSERVELSAPAPQIAANED